MSIITKKNSVITICSMMPFIAIFLIMHYFSVILDKKHRQVRKAGTKITKVLNYKSGNPCKLVAPFL
jgi:hypothetical protein